MELQLLVLQIKLNLQHKLERIPFLFQMEIVLLLLQILLLLILHQQLAQLAELLPFVKDNQLFLRQLLEQLISGY